MRRHQILIGLGGTAGVVAGVTATVAWPMGRSLAATILLGWAGVIAGALLEASLRLIERRARRGWIPIHHRVEPHTVALLPVHPTGRQLADPEHFWHEISTWR